MTSYTWKYNVDQIRDEIYEIISVIISPPAQNTTYILMSLERMLSRIFSANSTQISLVTESIVSEIIQRFHGGIITSTLQTYHQTLVHCLTDYYQSQVERILKGYIVNPASLGTAYLYHL